MAGNRILVVTVMVIVSITAFAFRSRKTQKPPLGQPVSSVDTPHPAQALALEKLASLLAPHGVHVTKQAHFLETDGHKRLDVHWEIKAPSQQLFSSEPARAPSGNFAVKEIKVLAGRLPRLRGLELSTTKLLVIGVDNNASLRWWHLMTDPRLLRAETVDSTGQLRAQVSYSSQTDFVVAYPDNPEITELRFYQPEWNGESFTLNSLGTLSVR